MKKTVKNDINFLESQKAGSKEGRSTSFATIAVAGIVLVVGLVAFAYIYTKGLKDELVDEKTTAEAKIAAAQKAEEDYKQKIADLDAQITLMQGQIDNFGNTGSAADGTANLTPAHVRAMYTTAWDANMEVKSLALAGTTVTFIVTTDRFENIQVFNDKIQHKNQKGESGYSNGDLFVFNPNSYTYDVTSEQFTITYSLTILAYNG